VTLYVENKVFCGSYFHSRSQCGTIFDRAHAFLLAPAPYVAVPHLAPFPRYSEILVENRRC